MTPMKMICGATSCRSGAGNSGWAVQVCRRAFSGPACRNRPAGTGPPEPGHRNRAADCLKTLYFFGQAAPSGPGRILVRRSTMAPARNLGMSPYNMYESFQNFNRWSMKRTLISKGLRLDVGVGQIIFNGMKRTLISKGLRHNRFYRFYFFLKV